MSWTGKCYLSLVFNHCLSASQCTSLHTHDLHADTRRGKPSALQWHFDSLRPRPGTLIWIWLKLMQPEWDGESRPLLSVLPSWLLSCLISKRLHSEWRLIICLGASSPRCLRSAHARGSVAWPQRAPVILQQPSNTDTSFFPSSSFCAFSFSFYSPPPLPQPASPFPLPVVGKCFFFTSSSPFLCIFYSYYFFRGAPIRLSLVIPTSSFLWHLILQFCTFFFVSQEENKCTAGPLMEFVVLKPTEKEEFNY